MPPGLATTVQRVCPQASLSTYRGPKDTASREGPWLQLLLRLASARALLPLLTPRPRSLPEPTMDFARLLRDRLAEPPSTAVQWLVQSLPTPCSEPREPLAQRPWLRPSYDTIDDVFRALAPARLDLRQLGCIAHQHYLARRDPYLAYCSPRAVQRLPVTVGTLAVDPAALSPTGPIPACGSCSKRAGCYYEDCAS